MPIHIWNRYLIRTAMLSTARRTIIHYALHCYSCTAHCYPLYTVHWYTLYCALSSPVQRALLSTAWCTVIPVQCTVNFCTAHCYSLSVQHALLALFSVLHTVIPCTVHALLFSVWRTVIPCTLQIVIHCNYRQLSAKGWTLGSID